jgi:hypothetical protein
MSSPLARCCEAALTYLERGWAVLPLCPPDHKGCSEEHVNGCTNPGQTPLIPWKSLQSRLPRPTEIKLWWTRWPLANIGVVLGAASKLVAVDLDGQEASDLLARVLPGGQRLPPTLEFRTLGGRRLLYTLPPTLTVPCRRFDGPGCHVLVMGEGTWSVLPPSIHPGGGQYSWS